MLFRSYARFGKLLNISTANDCIFTVVDSEPLVEIFASRLFDESFKVFMINQIILLFFISFLTITVGSCVLGEAVQQKNNSNDDGHKTKAREPTKIQIKLEMEQKKKGTVIALMIARFYL